MLPKRSTPVEQNVGSESTHSQLSGAIFRALRDRVGAQKSLMYFQTCQKHSDRYDILHKCCLSKKKQPKLQ